MSNSSWYEMTQVRSAQTRRASSWDRTGKNADWVVVPPGETKVLAEIDGPGVIDHIYFTMIRPCMLDYRDAVLRMYWDGEDTPSVEVPFGDFFCVSNCTIRQFASLRIAVNPGAGARHQNNGYNCYFPMPFADGARIEIENQSKRVFGGICGALWYHIDYEALDAPPPKDTGRFHAQWRRENLTARVAPEESQHVNLTGAENYVMLEAEGHGHIAGLFLQVNNVQGGWYGEGDDMIFVDGDTWPPSQHGTGSEEVFGGGACPDKEYAGPYTGFLLVENKDGDTFKGKNAMYRWYETDPIRFKERVKMTIEHGHANDLANDYASVAYWYQLEPHAPFPPLPGIDARRPILPDAFYKAFELYEELLAIQLETRQECTAEGKPAPDWYAKSDAKLGEGDDRLVAGDYDKAEKVLSEGLAIARKGRTG